MSLKDLPYQKSTPSELDAIQGLGERFPVSPVRVVGREMKPPPSGARRGPDVTLALEWEGQVQRFAVEYKTPGTPKQLDIALQQVRRYTYADPHLAPLIVAPYLRQELLERLIGEGVSGIDLSGNYGIVVPGRWLVLRTGSKNKYPLSAPIKNVYRGKSSLVARALMMRGQFASATAIMRELDWLDVTLPTISKVLKSLEDELLIERGGVIKVLQPDRLLENILLNYEAPKERHRIFGKLALDEAVGRRIDENSRRTGILYAVSQPAQYTVLPSSGPVTRLYTASTARLTDDIVIDPSTRFPNFELIETSDLTAYYDRRKHGDLFFTSPLQIYLELATGEKREKQAAQQIRTDLLNFKYRDQ